MRLSQENQESLVAAYINALQSDMTDVEYQERYEYSNLTDAQTAMDLGEILFYQKQAATLGNMVERAFSTTH